MLRFLFLATISLITVITTSTNAYAKPSSASQLEEKILKYIFSPNTEDVNQKPGEALALAREILKPGLSNGASASALSNVNLILLNITQVQSQMDPIVFGTIMIREKYLREALVDVIMKTKGSFEQDLITYFQSSASEPELKALARKLSFSLFDPKSGSGKTWSGLSEKQSPTALGSLIRINTREKDFQKKIEILSDEINARQSVRSVKFIREVLSIAMGSFKMAGYTTAGSAMGLVFAEYIANMTTQSYLDIKDTTVVLGGSALTTVVLRSLLNLSRGFPIWARDPRYAFRKRLNTTIAKIVGECPAVMTALPFATGPNGEFTSR